MPGLPTGDGAAGGVCALRVPWQSEQERCRGGAMLRVNLPGGPAQPEASLGGLFCHHSQPPECELHVARAE